MIIVKQISQLNALIDRQKQAEKLIGFVPTMGALHAGHLSLVNEASIYSDFIVCSIFVNPTQFNSQEDLNLYPRTLEADAKMLALTPCDVLFVPSVEEMYPNGMQKDSADSFGNYIKVLEGAKRPGHFDGVITVVKRLFELVRPDKVFFGQKDYQQCLVVKELITKTNKAIQFYQCPIVREHDGLAMSSRNARLSVAERELASLIPAVVGQAKMELKNGRNWQEIMTALRKKLQLNPQIQLEYFVVCDADSLEELAVPSLNAIVLIALSIGKTRLIDNILLLDN